MVAAGASIAAQELQRLVVVGHWHAIVIGPSNRSRISAFGVGLAPSATASTPEVVQLEVSISLQQGSIPIGAIVETGTAWAVPVAEEPAILFLRANTAWHLVGISVGIGSTSRQEMS